MMYKVIIILAVLFSTAAYAQEEEYVYDPGCTPKADVPDSLLKYFEKFKQPLPEKYCQSATVPPTVQEQQTIQEEQQQEDPQEGPPEGQENAQEPDMAPPEGQHTLPDSPPAYDVPYEPQTPDYPAPNGYIREGQGGFEINTPFFHMQMQFDRRRHEQKRRWRELK
jgi:hypothetical protein